MSNQAAAGKPVVKGKRPPVALLEARRRQDKKRTKPINSRGNRPRTSGQRSKGVVGKLAPARPARSRNAITVRRQKTSPVRVQHPGSAGRQRVFMPREVQPISISREYAAAGRMKAAAATRSGLSGTGYAILGVALLMFLYGMVMIFSASSGSAFYVHGSSYYFLVRQAIWFGVGLIALICLAYIDYHHLAQASPVLVAIALAALAAVPFFGFEAYGSRRAITLGPMVFQPSEFAKMSLLILAVYIYNKRRGSLDDWREIIMPVLLVTGLACVLILTEPDLGTMLIAAISVFVALFLARAPLRKLAFLAFVGASATAFFIYSSPYRRARWLAFLHPEKAPLEGGFHIIQSKVALGSGSMTGLGLGMSRQKFFYLPNAHTDFIFSIIGEEIGLIGTIAVLLLFTTFICLGFKAARRAPDGLGRLLAMSITCMIAIQALINMGAATGVLPVTGVTLPFFSYGGSSLVICMCLAGILINVSRQEVEVGIPPDGRKKRERGDMRRRNRWASPSPSGPRRGAPVA